MANRRKNRKKSDKQLLLALGTIIGTAVGAGTFGLPYVASKAGFFPVLGMFVVLGIFTVYTNLMYGEVALRTRKSCRLTGYAGQYLGIWGKRFASAVAFFSLYSSVLVYIILGGVFLNSLLSGFLGGDEFLYGVAIFVFISTAAYFNLNLFCLIESYLVFFMLVAMSVIMLKAAPHIDVNNFMTADPSYFFLPFGTILFALSATMAIPEFEHIMDKSRNRIKGAILGGTVSYIAIYLLFIIAILGVTGPSTSEESFAGLSLFIGDGVITLGLLFGLLAVVTSYLMMAISIKEIFMYDYKIGEKLSWFLSCFFPFAVFVAGMRNFIQVLNIAGSVMGGFIGILIILIFYRAKKNGDVKPAYSIEVSESFSALMIFIYLLGIIYQFIYKNW